jgi:hypothetical protein
MTAVSTLRGYRQFYYGGAEGVADKLKEALIADYPGLEVAGTLAPVPRDFRGGSGHRRHHRCGAPRHRVGGARRTQAGVLDGEPPRAH